MIRLVVSVFRSSRVVAAKEKKELKEDESLVPLEFMHLSQLEANRRRLKLGVFKLAIKIKYNFIIIRCD